MQSAQSGSRLAEIEERHQEQASRLLRRRLQRLAEDDDLGGRHVLEDQAASVQPGRVQGQFDFG